MSTRRSLLKYSLTCTGVLASGPLRPVLALCPPEKRDALGKPPLASADPWGELLAQFLKGDPQVAVRLPGMPGLKAVIEALQDAELEDDVRLWIRRGRYYRDTLLYVMVNAMEEAAQNQDLYCLVERLLANASLGAIEKEPADPGSLASIRAVVRVRLRQQVEVWKRTL